MNVSAAPAKPGSLSQCSPLEVRRRHPKLSPSAEWQLERLEVCTFRAVTQHISDHFAESPVSALSPLHEVDLPAPSPVQQRGIPGDFYLDDEDSDTDVELIAFGIAKFKL